MRVMKQLHSLGRGQGRRRQLVPQLPLENFFSVGNGKIVQSTCISHVHGETDTVLFFIEV